MLELVVDGVTLTQRGERWLDAIDLRLTAGISVLIGPTLAGKTTLMRVIAGLVPPSSGRIEVNGVDVTATPVRERSVAFVYQQFINYPSLTVYDNIASPLVVAGGMTKAEIDGRVREVAELMEITPQLKRRPSELSGGQQQRTAIARALARKADVVLLDEPLANLDYKLREHLRSELRRIFADAGMIVVYSTSDPAEALTFATTTVVLSEGRVEQTGQAVEIYRRPRNVAVARTLSDPPINLLPAVVRDDLLHFAGVSHPVPAAIRHAATSHGIKLGIRPHQFTLQPTNEEDIELAATVQLAEVTGSTTFLHAEVAGGEHVVAALDGTHPHPPGEGLTLYVKPAALHAFDAETNELLVSALVEAGPRG